MKFPLMTAAMTAIAVGSLAFSAQAQAAAPLTVNWRHDADVLAPVIAAFEHDTGIDVTITDDYDTFNTDVILVSDYQTLTAAKKIGRFQRLESALANEIVPPRWRDRDGYYDRVDALYRELGWPQNW